MNDSVTICPHRAKVIPGEPPITNVNKYRLTSRKFGGEIPQNWVISVDNFSPELLNTDRFRLCFMSNRQGRTADANNVFGWRCRMLYDLVPHPKDLMTPEADATKWFLPIKNGEMFLIQNIRAKQEFSDGEEQGVSDIPSEVINQLPTETDIHNAIYALNVLSLIAKAHYSDQPDGSFTCRFKYNGCRNKLEVGFAIWEKTGRGPYGWERVSNISGIQLRIKNRANVPTNNRQDVEYSSRIISIP